MVRRLLISLLLLVSITLNTVAQVLIARPFPFTRQLYTNEVYTVFQDCEGYIWLGTTAGLERWDGYRLRPMRSLEAHHNLLAHNHILIIADSPDLLWVVTNRGLVLLDKSNGQTLSPSDPRLREKEIVGIQNDGEQGMWIATKQHLYHCNSTGAEVKEVTLMTDENIEFGISDIYKDTEDTLWVMCHHGVLFRGCDNSFEKLPSQPHGYGVGTMSEDSEGHYWMGTWGDGLWQFFPNGDGPNGYWLQHDFTSYHSDSPERIVFRVCQDRSKGWLWILTYDGLHVLENKEGKLKHVEVPSYVAPILSNAYTNMIFDREGNLWLSAYDEGYTISFSSSGIYNEHLSHLSQQQKKETDLLNIYADGEYVWLNQDRKGLELFNRKSGRIAHLPYPFQSELRVLRPSRSEGAVWIADRYAPIVTRLIRQDTTVRPNLEINLTNEIGEKNPVTNLVEDKQRTLWMLAHDHLIARLAEEENAMLTSDLSDVSAMSIALDEEGILCTTDSTLYQCRINTRHIACNPIASLTFLSEDEHIRSLAIDASGAVWVATSHGRTLRSDSSMKSFSLSPVDSLVQDGLVQDMLVQGRKVWVMTDKHLIAYDIDLSSTNIYSAGKGIVEIQGFRHHALCADSDGVLAGGYGGFIRIPANTGTSVPSLSNPVLTDVLIGKRSLFFDATTAPRCTFRHVILPPSSRNIEFHLSLLSYVLGSISHIQYRLEGADTEWNDADASNPIAFYNHLTCGTYSLFIRVQRPDGNWYEPVNVATIERLPYWFETRWAFTLYLIIICIILAAIVWYIRHRQTRKLHTEVTQAKVAIITSDHPLTDQMVKIIDRHIGDCDFGLEQLIEEMNTSKTTLYRQLKNETDITPADLLRSIRMKRACEMLLARKMNVSEVAYATGFSSPKYFTRCFKEDFGQTPTEYTHSHQTQTQPTETTHNLG